MLAQGCRPTPIQAHRIEQLGRCIATEQHQGKGAKGMQVHPALWGGGAGQLRRAITGGHAGLATHQAVIEQHRQAIALPAQHVGGAEITVDQLLAMQHRHHRQQLAQQQQHFSCPKHQLAFRAGLKQLLVGAARLPLPHQPQLITGRDRSAQAGHLGMEHPLQAAPELAGCGLVLVGAQLPQGHRSVAGQLVAGPPELALGPLTQALLQAIALPNHLANHLPNSGIHQIASTWARWGCWSPFVASQSPS